MHLYLQMFSFGRLLAHYGQTRPPPSGMPPHLSPGTLSRGELVQHGESPLYSVRAEAVFPAAGVRVVDLKKALTIPTQD